MIGIDSTYQVSCDSYSVSVFVCVNNYGVSEIAAICFHMEENSRNFSFALESYLLAGFKCPDIVFTDRSKALMKAVNDQWLQTYKNMKHFLCVYHIYRNIQEYLGIQSHFHVLNFCSKKTIK